MRHSVATLDNVLGTASVSNDSTTDDLQVSPQRLIGASVFEGRDCDHDDDNLPSVADKEARMTKSDEVLAISDVVDFFDAISRAGACR